MSQPSKPKLLVTLYVRWWAPDLVTMLAERFDLRVRVVRRRPRAKRTVPDVSKTELVLDELRFFVRLLASPSLYLSSRRFVCLGGHYATLLFARLLRPFGQRNQTYLLNFYLHGLSSNAMVKRVLAFLLTSDVRLIAQSTADADYFRQFLSEEQVIRLPYSQGPSPVPLSEAEPGEYVFSGGWTNRDYDALLRCAARLPHIEFVIVSSWHTTISEPIPSNVSLLRDRDPIEFDRLLARSRLVVIPLRDDVGSSGQMVLLSAMQFGKTTVVPRVGAVADYIDDGRTGIFYPLGDDDSLVAAISGLYGDEARTAEIGRAAREAYFSRFTPARFNRTVVDCIANGVSS